MSNDNIKTNIAVKEPLLNKNSNNKQSENSEKVSKVEDVKNKQISPSENQRKRTKSVAIIEEENEKEMEKWQLVPPDGGWGWLVLFGSTLVNVLVPGMLKSFGVLFVEFQEAFQASPTTASWIPALAYFLYSSLGPVSSLLSVRFSYRSVTIAGGTFAAFGMIVSFFATSIHFLYVSYGVMVGIGAGLAFPPTVYIVTSYFLRLRGLANGICISGSALGSIILPPVVRILLETYGYRGAVLLMGGITLNVWVAALFYDDVSKHLKRVLKKSSDSDDENLESPKPKFLLSGEESMSSLQQIPHNDSFLENLDLSSNAFNRSVSSAAVANLKNQNRERKISMPISRNEVMKARYSTGSSRSHINSSSALHAVPEAGNTAMDLFSQNRLPASRRPRRSPSTSSFLLVSTPFHGSTLTLSPETFASSFSLKSSSLKKGGTIQEDEESLTPKRFFDLSVLKDPIYLIILISNATNAISYTNFIILLPTYATSLDFDKNKAALLLSIVSALDLVGRIGGSALSDLPLCPKEWYFIIGLFVSGISLTFMPFFVDYAAICVFCAFFGLASGVYVGITAVIMTDMLGEEKLQSTYGISLFVNGILQLVGPPLCGVYLQTVGSYHSLFCMLGVFLIVGTSIWGFLPFVRKRNKSLEDIPDSP